jgi:hypothetical protein
LEIAWRMVWGFEKVAIKIIKAALFHRGGRCRCVFYNCYVPCFFNYTCINLFEALAVALGKGKGNEYQYEQNNNKAALRRGTFHVVK